MNKNIPYIGGPRDGQSTNPDGPPPETIALTGGVEGHYRFNREKEQYEWKVEMWRCVGGPLDGEVRPGSGIAAKGMIEDGHRYHRYSIVRDGQAESVWRYLDEVSQE